MQIDVESFLLSLLDVSSLFEELLVEVNGYQDLGNHIPGELSNLEQRNVCRGINRI